LHSLSIEESFCVSTDDMKCALKELTVGGLLRRLDPIEGAIDAINELSKVNKIYLITARGQHWEKGNPHDDTEYWLHKHDIHYDKLICAGNVPKIHYTSDVDIFIEDNLSTANDIAEHSHIPVLLFDQPWNRDMAQDKNVYRIFSWNDVFDVLYLKFKGVE
jgi:uncharacterized HAD superfamily protein